MKKTSIDAGIVLDERLRKIKVFLNDKVVPVDKIREGDLLSLNDCTSTEEGKFFLFKLWDGPNTMRGRAIGRGNDSRGWVQEHLYPNEYSHIIIMARDAEIAANYLDSHIRRVHELENKRRETKRNIDKLLGLD